MNLEPSRILRSLTLLLTAAAVILLALFISGCACRDLDPPPPLKDFGTSQDLDAER